MRFPKKRSIVEENTTYKSSTSQLFHGLELFPSSKRNIPANASALKSYMVASIVKFISIPFNVDFLAID